MDLIVIKIIERFLVYYCYVSGSLNVRLIERKFILKKHWGQTHFDLNFIVRTGNVHCVTFKLGKNGAWPLCITIVQKKIFLKRYDLL